MAAPLLQSLDARWAQRPPVCLGALAVLDLPWLPSEGEGATLSESGLRERVGSGLFVGS